MPYLLAKVLKAGYCSIDKILNEVQKYLLFTGVGIYGLDIAREVIKKAFVFNGFLIERL